MSFKQTKIINKKLVKLNKEKKNINYQYFFLFLILILTTIGFIYSVKNDFIFWDDDKQITDNPFIKSLSFSNIAHNFSKEGFTFLPLFTYAIDYKIWGLNPYPFHLINLFIHLVNVTLVFYFIKLITKRHEVALITCLLFAIHPMRVESVAWISERKDLLFSLFFISSLIFYHYYVNKGLKRKYLIYTFICGYLSSLSKIQALSLPFILLVLDYFYGRIFNFRTLIEKLVLLIFMFLYILFSFISPVIPFIYLFIEKTFHLFYYFFRSIFLQLTKFYFYNQNNFVNSPIYLIIIILTIYFIISMFSINIKNKFKNFYPIRHFIFPVLIFFIFHILDQHDIIVIIFYLFILVYFVYYEKYKSHFDLTGFILTLIFFCGISLYFTSDFFNNIILIFPFILWFAFDFFYMTNKSSFFDFLFHKLILFLILSVVIFVQLINPFYEYCGIIIIVLVYITKRKRINLYFSAKSKAASITPEKEFSNLIISSQKSFKKIIKTLSNGIILLYSNKKLKYILLFFIVLLIFFIEKNKISFWSQNDVQEYSFNFLDRIFLASYSFVFYVVNYFYPFNLSAIHSYPLKTGCYLPLIYYLSFIGMLIIFTLGYYSIRKYSKYRKELIFGVLFFLVNISLVMHIIPIQGRLVTADRYTYLAYLGLFYITGQIFIWVKENKISNLIKKSLLLIFIAYLLALFVYTYNRSKVWKDSIVLFNDVIEKNPEISLAYNNRGWSEFNLNDWQSALSDFNKAISLDSGFAGVYNNRGWLKYNMGDLSGALKDYNIALKMYPNFSLVYNNRGKAKIDLNDNKGALEDFNNAIKLNPLNAIAWCNRAKIKIDNKDYKSAIDDLNRSLELNPDLSLAYYNRGLVKVKLGNIKGAVEDYSFALKKDTTFALAYNNRGYANYLLNNLALAESDYNHAILYQPNYAIAYKNRGWIKYKLNDFTGAINDYSSAIKLQPDFFEAYNNRGYIKIQTGDYKGAIEDFTIVINSNPSFSYAYNYRGLAKSDLKDYFGAIEDFNKALEIEPGYFDVINNRGWAYFNLKKINEAISDYKRAISVYKSDISYKNLAWTYYSTNNFQEAIKNYSVAIQLSPLNSQSYFYRGMSFFKINNLIDACKDWEKAKKLGENQSDEYIAKYCK